MKNLLKKLSCLMVVAFVAVSLFSCALTPQTTLEFTAFPEAEYNVGETTEAQFLENVKVKLDGKEITLNTLKGLGATITGIHLDKAGSYTLVVNYEGVSIVFEYDVVGLYEASLNGVDYETLGEALADAPAGEASLIKVLKNINLEASSVIVEKNKNIKLDLNGFAIYGVNNQSVGSYLICNKGTLEICGEGLISYLSLYPDVEWGTEGFPAYATNTIRNEGNLVVNGNVEIENQTNKGGASYVIDNYAGSSLTIENGIIKQTGGDVAIRLFAGGAINVTINGGEISGRRAIWVQLPSNNINVAPAVNLTVNGGKLSGTQFAIYCYSYGNSFANTKVVFNGGEFLGQSVAFGAFHKDSTEPYTTQETVEFNGGIFEYDVIRYTAEGQEVIYKANK